MPDGRINIPCMYFFLTLPLNGFFPLFSFKKNLDCVSKYLQVLKLTNGRLPISIATAGSCLSWRETQADEPEEKVLLFGYVVRSSLVPVFPSCATLKNWGQNEHPGGQTSDF